MCNSQSNTNRRNCQSQMSKTWNWLLVIGFIYSPSSSSLVFGEDRVRHRIPSHPRSYDSNLHVVMEPNYSPSSLYSPPSIMEANRMLFFPKRTIHMDTLFFFLPFVVGFTGYKLSYSSFFYVTIYYYFRPIITRHLQLFQLDKLPKLYMSSITNFMAVSWKDTDMSRYVLFLGNTTNRWYSIEYSCFIIYWLHTHTLFSLHCPSSSEYSLFLCV